MPSIIVILSFVSIFGIATSIYLFVELSRRTAIHDAELKLAQLRARETFDRTVASELTARHQAEIALATSQAILAEFKANNELSISLEPDIKRGDGFFKRTNRVWIKARIYKGNMPLPGTFIIERREFSEINDDNIKLLLNEVASPLLQAGVKVLSLAV